MNLLKVFSGAVFLIDGVKNSVQETLLCQKILYVHGNCLHSNSKVSPLSTVTVEVRFRPTKLCTTSRYTLPCPLFICKYTIVMTDVRNYCALHVLNYVFR